MDRTDDVTAAPTGTISRTRDPYPDPAIEVKDLVKIYPGGKAAIDGISFAVDRGEIFGFLGPNGSGKTTTVRILVTLLRKTSGVARVAGFDTDSEPGRIRELIGYAGQTTGIDDDLTVHENLVLQGLLHGFAPNQHALVRLDELLELFSLTEVTSQRASRLSGGLRRRLDLAQALVHRPLILFLDEPTTGLDPQSRKALWEQLRRLSREQGTTVFLTTQYLEEADRTCDRVVILDRGRLVTVGTPNALKEEVGEGRLVLSLRENGNTDRAIRALAASPDVTRVEPGDPLVVYVRDVSSSVVSVIRLLEEEGIKVTAVEQARASLDDVFLRYTGDRPRAEAPVVGAVSSIFGAAHGRRRRGGAA
jgi:ABC-2 type transport system ATP-binding protein